MSKRWGWPPASSAPERTGAPWPALRASATEVSAFWSSRREASASNWARRTDSGPCTVEATSVSRSSGPTVACSRSFSAIASWRSWRWSRSLSPWATATQVARTVASAVITRTSVWRGALRRMSRVHVPSASGLEPSAISPPPATSSHSASAGVIEGHASWTSRRTGIVDVPPSSTDTPNAAVKTPAVLSAIRSSPAQPDGARRFRSSTWCSSARQPCAQYNGCPLDAKPVNLLTSGGLDVPKLLCGDLGSDHAEVQAGAELEPGEVRQPRQDVDPPAEVVGPLRRRADPQVQRRRRAEAAPQAQQRVVQERRSGRAVILVAGARPARDEHELERQPRGVGGEQDRLVVDRDHAVAHPNLLLQQVAEQVAAHRARRVGGEALALPGDGGGDERQRVELRMGVRERGAALAALVDEQVDERGIGVSAHAGAPRLGGGGHLLRRQVGERGDPVPRGYGHPPGARRGPGGGEGRGPG